MLLGRKAGGHPDSGAPRRGDGGGGAAAARRCRRGRAERSCSTGPTDVAWDAAGNIFVADGLGNARVAKFNKQRRVRQVLGLEGHRPGQFGTVRAIAVDAQGNVYVADGGNKRIQVFDNDGTFKTQYHQCRATRRRSASRPGRTSFSTARTRIRRTTSTSAGEIYKMKLDGTIVGKFGRAGKLPKEFGTVNAIDCRNENTLLVGEIGNMRVQKLTLK